MQDGCAHRNVTMDGWGWATVWESGYQDGVALWVMRASPMGEWWALGSGSVVCGAAVGGYPPRLSYTVGWAGPAGPAQLQGARRRPAACTLGWQLWSLLPEVGHMQPMWPTCHSVVRPRRATCSPIVAGEPELHGLHYVSEGWVGRGR